MVKQTKRRKNMSMATPPIANRKYRQPIFLLFVQFVSVCWHVKFPRSGHATRVANTCANAQSIDRTVRRYWWLPGKNSRKMALSTGKLPPTPTDHRAAKVPMAAKFGDPAAIRPKTAVTPMVRLKAHRRPKISHPKPQNMAPTRSPMFWARVRKGARFGWNSFLTGVKINDVTIGQRLSDAHPKPMTMKS